MKRKSQSTIAPVEFIDRVIKLDEKGEPWQLAPYQRKVLEMAFRRELLKISGWSRKLNSKKCRAKVQSFHTPARDVLQHRSCRLLHWNFEEIRAMSKSWKEYDDVNSLYGCEIFLQIVKASNYDQDHHARNLH